MTHLATLLFCFSVHMFVLELINYIISNITRILDLLEQHPWGRVLHLVCAFRPPSPQREAAWTPPSRDSFRYWNRICTGPLNIY